MRPLSFVMNGGLKFRFGEVARTVEALVFGDIGEGDDRDWGERVG